MYLLCQVLTRSTAQHSEEGGTALPTGPGAARKPHRTRGTRDGSSLGSALPRARQKQRTCPCAFPRVQAERLPAKGSYPQDGHSFLAALGVVLIFLSGMSGFSVMLTHTWFPAQSATMPCTWWEPWMRLWSCAA